MTTSNNGFMKHSGGGGADHRERGGYGTCPSGIGELFVVDYEAGQISVCQEAHDNPCLVAGVAEENVSSCMRAVGIE